MKIKKQRIFFKLRLTKEQNLKLESDLKELKLSDYFSRILLDFVNKKILFINNLRDETAIKGEFVLISSSCVLSLDVYLEYVKLLNVNINGLDILLSDNQLLTALFINYIDSLNNQ